MMRIVPNVRAWFEAKNEHLRAFARADCRVEGWFKGELLVLFERMRRKGLLDSIEREANVPISEPVRRAQVDFRIAVGGDTHLCEIKALCISQAAGTPRNLQFYFRDDRVGLLKDMRKLDKLQGANKWILGFIYPNPLLADWNRAPLQCCLRRSDIGTWSRHIRTIQMLCLSHYGRDRPHHRPYMSVALHNI